MNWRKYFELFGDQPQAKSPANAEAESSPPVCGCISKGDTDMFEMLQESPSNGRAAVRIQEPALCGKTSFTKHLRWKLKAAQPEAEYISVTPAMATEMLKYNASATAHNRPLSDATTRKYAQLIKDRYWGVDGLGTSEPIIFSDAGRLLSGQHRLYAVVASGATQRFLVVFGEPDGNFAYIDQGRRRTGADIFSIYDVPNYTLAAAAIAWVWKYELDKWGSATVSAQELYEFYTQHERIQDSMFIGREFSKSKLSPPAPMVALHYLCARKNRAMADEFFMKVATGIGLNSKTAPTYKLHRRLTDNAMSASAKLDSVLIAAFTVKAWNAHRANRLIGVLKWRTEQSPNEPFPKVA